MRTIPFPHVCSIYTILHPPLHSSTLDRQLPARGPIDLAASRCAHQKCGLVSDVTSLSQAKPSQPAAHTIPIPLRTKDGLVTFHDANKPSHRQIAQEKKSPPTQSSQGNETTPQAARTEPPPPPSQTKSHAQPHDLTSPEVNLPSGGSSKPTSTGSPLHRASLRICT